MERDTVRLVDSYDFSVLFPATLHTFLVPLCSSSRAKDTPFISGGEILITAGPIYRLLVFPRKEGFVGISGINVTSPFDTTYTLFAPKKSQLSYLYVVGTRKFCKKLRKPQKRCVNIRRCSTLERFRFFYRQE